MIVKAVVYKGRDILVFQETSLYDFFFAPALNIVPDSKEEMEVLQRYARLMSMPKMVWATDRYVTTLGKNS